MYFTLWFPAPFSCSLKLYNKLDFAKSDPVSS